MILPPKKLFHGSFLKRDPSGRCQLSCFPSWELSFWVYSGALFLGMLRSLEVGKNDGHDTLKASFWAMQVKGCHLSCLFLGCERWGWVELGLLTITAIMPNPLGCFPLSCLSLTTGSVSDLIVRKRSLSPGCGAVPSLHVCCCHRHLRPS